MRFRHTTYGQQIDACTQEIARLEEVVKQVPRRAPELEQARRLGSMLQADIRLRGKRRASCFYGFNEASA